jgi:hypothetical protein
VIGRVQSKAGSFRLVIVVIMLIAMMMIGLGQAVASTSEGDFDVDSEEWNGLAQFVALADGVDLQVVDRLHWADVDADDVLIIIYPQQAVDVDSSARFLLQGGRMVVADDFGESTGILSRLSIERRTPAPEELPHELFVDDHRGWPIFRPQGRHPLLDGVDELVGNYPALFYNVGGPVVAYDRDGGFVYDMKLGEGRALAIADPGIFINAMLSAADNRRFAENIWTYLCADVEECRAWLLVGEFETTGTFSEEAADGAEELRERIDELNQRLREVFNELAGSQFLFFLALFLALGSLAYLAVVFPWRQFAALSRYIDRHRRDLSPPSTEFDWNVARFSNPDGTINYTLPMAILKESFDELFLDAFGLWPSEPYERPSMSQLARRFEERYLRGQSPQVRKERRREVESLLADLNSVPDRHHVFLESDQSFSARDLRKLNRRIRRVLKWMGLEESYERRTREINPRRGRASRR